MKLSTKTTFSTVPLLLGAGLLTGCNLAPAYHVPTSAPVTTAFKAAPGWVAATPDDAVAKGQWWAMFGDPVLDSLESKVVVTNQNVAAYRAAYAQALALVRADRAAQLPTAGVNASVVRQRTTVANTPVTVTGLTGGATASWVPDIWGKLTDATRAARYDAEAAAALLVNATLSAQATLAQDYLNLRAIDAQKALLDETIKGYRRSLSVTQFQYKAGTVNHADVDSAESTLQTALANREDLERQRAALENAVAVLAGENPSSFRIASAAWKPVVPDVPATVPAQVLERRPDVANSERLVAAANANVGIARGAFFPDITLTAVLDSTAGAVGGLFGAANTLWSLGAGTSETVLDFGARSAKVAEARAAYDQTVATYRQTVLGAFQEVETDLSAVTAYAAEDPSYKAAAAAALRAEKLTRDEYQAGTIDYTTVAAAQATAYSARVAEITNTFNRQNSAVALIQAIGGEWTGKIDLHPPLRPTS